MSFHSWPETTEEQFKEMIRRHKEDIMTKCRINNLSESEERVRSDIVIKLKDAEITVEIN